MSISRIDFGMDRTRMRAGGVVTEHPSTSTCFPFDSARRYLTHLVIVSCCVTVKHVPLSLCI